MTAPLRIGLLATARYPIVEPFTGGLASHVATLARGLAGRGHEVTVIAPDGSDLGPGIDVLPIGTASGLEFSAAARRDMSMLAEPFMQEHHAYLCLLSSLAKEPRFDVLHNHGFHYLPIAMARTIPGAHVTTLHAPPTPWQESAAKCLAPHERPVFLTVSETNRRIWSRSLAGVTSVPNGIDLSGWPLAETPDPDLAVWTGRIVPEKGPHFAIDAARRAGYRIVLAGPTPDREFFDAEVAPRLDASAELAGHLTQAELAELIGSASVALSTPCWDEPFGLTTVEALACGTPVAAFDRGAMRTLLCDRSGRLAEPESSADLSGAVLEAASLNRSDARARAEQVASVDRMLDGVEAAYARAMRRARLAA